MPDTKTHRDDIQPVVLGGDIGAYALGREFHEAYGVRSIFLNTGFISAITHSKIVECHPVEAVAAGPVMDALEEGLFAIDTEGRVTVMNRAARKMLELPDSVNPEGRLLTDYYPETMLPTTVRTGITEHDVSFMIRGKHIISSRIPVRRKGKITGAVSIFRNKTEVTKLAEELTGTRYMIETLRAVNHEFTNKLHVILGLLEMNEIPEAKEYITGTSLISGQAVSDISRRVPIPSLAALLIGKLMKANEMGIRFVLKQDTFFNSKESGLPVDCFITLVGNLLENAMDELNSGDFPEKAIELGIYSEA